MIYPKVNYEDKEIAKKWGAIWNPKIKKWGFETEDKYKRFTNYINNRDKKYYIHKKFAINFDGIVADISIDKGMKGFISDKLEEIYKDKNPSIYSFKVVTPYLDFKYLLDDKEKPFNLSKDAKKIFVISSQEVKNNRIEKEVRHKLNQKFLEDLTYYIQKTYGNGKTVLEQNFENNMEIYPLKYHSFPKDHVPEEKKYFNLHTKIYLINDKYAFIGSANLTQQGLKSNFETLFFVNGQKEENKKLIESLNDFFEKIRKEAKIKNIEFEDNIFDINDSGINQNSEKDRGNSKNNENFLSRIKSIFKNFNS